MFMTGGIGIAHLDDFRDGGDGIVQQPLQASEILSVFFFDPYPFRHVVHHLNGAEILPLSVDQRVEGDFIKAVLDGEDYHFPTAVSPVHGKAGIFQIWRGAVKEFARPGTDDFIIGNPDEVGQRFIALRDAPAGSTTKTGSLMASKVVRHCCA